MSSETKALMFEKHILKVAQREHEARCLKENIWEELEYSICSRILQDVFKGFDPNAIRIALNAMWRQSRNMNKNSETGEWEKKVASIINKISQECRGCWKHQTISMRRSIAKLAIKQQWSLETGIRYPSGSEEVTISKEGIKDMVEKYNIKVEDMRSQLMANLAKCPSGPPLNFTYHKMNYTSTDVWGSTEDWMDTIKTPSAKWSQIRNYIRNKLIAEYDEKTSADELVMTIHRGQTIYQLRAMRSIYGQFDYIYDVMDASGKTYGRVSYESMLGLGIGAWDQIYSTNIEQMCLAFQKIDRIMRNHLIYMDNH